MNYTEKYIGQAVQILPQLDQKSVERVLELLLEVRARAGRIFFLGVGGGAGHASHAVNDFRKIAGIEAYTPTDNVSELTARVNDVSHPSSLSRAVSSETLSVGV
jgi:D-sedoheptulose 7-phosphate isomerase